MARSERSYPASDAQIRRWEEEAEAKRAFDAQRSVLIDTALRKLKKDELIDLLMSLDMYDPSVRWSIETELQVLKPVDLVANDLRHAIDIATRVDERRLNDNFHYSWQAYEEVARGFDMLVKQDAMESAKEISIEFMGKASYQVECSDEGMMVDEVEACLKSVIDAVKAGDAGSAKSWAMMMLAADSAGFICEAELMSLVGKDTK